MTDHNFSQLIPIYSSPDRAYHNLAHIQACLAEFEVVRSLASNPIAMQTAICFHDVIYDTHAHDNEERSADFAREQLQASGADETFINTVVELILATKHNQPVSGDAALLVDIDLAILGKPADEFARYDAAIRQEYAWVSEEAYRAGRSKVLQSFLDRETIYQTEFFRNRYEVQARLNLQQALLRLK
jgi:predicted metal-dependent HD superfamily phosphohydrolase